MLFADTKTVNTKIYALSDYHMFFHSHHCEYYLIRIPFVYAFHEHLHIMILFIIIYNLVRKTKIKLIIITDTCKHVRYTNIK